MNQPCAQDCAERSMTCRKTCAKWAEFEKYKAQIYKIRAERWIEESDAICVEIRRREMKRKRTK